MQIRVVTLRYNEALLGSPEEALHEVLNVFEHFFAHGNVLYWNNNNPSNDNNNGSCLVSTVPEQTWFHFDTPALRGRGDEHAPFRSASSPSDRRAKGGIVLCERY